MWTSPNGSAWRAAEPAGQGLTGPGIQAITSLTATDSTLTGVGFSASPTAEQPVFWQVPGPLTSPCCNHACPASPEEAATPRGRRRAGRTSSRRLARLGRVARTVAIRLVSTSATVTPAAGPRSARTTPSGSTSMLRPTPVAARVGRSSGSGTWPTAATHTVFSMARARTSVTQCSSLYSPAAHAAGITSSSAPPTASDRDSSPNRTS